MSKQNPQCNVEIWRTSQTFLMKAFNYLSCWKTIKLIALQFIYICATNMCRMLKAKTQLIFNKHQLQNIKKIFLLKSNEPTKYGENFKCHNEFMSDSTTLQCFMPFQLWKLLGQSTACSSFCIKNIINAPQALCFNLLIQSVFI
jgi:hypothetical protein